MSRGRWTLEDVQAYLARQAARKASHSHEVTTSVEDTTPESYADEKSFLGRVRRLARDNGYEFYHTWDSRKSDKGFPDAVLVRGKTTNSPGRLLFLELKSNTGKLTKEQALWLEILKHSVPGVEVFCWRPQDWEQIVAILA